MTLKERIKELEKSNDDLRYNNLMMKIHLDLLATDINSLASQKILAKYRRLRLIRKEQYLEGQN